MSADLSVALDWLDAIARRDRDRLLALSSADIVLHGPRGAAKGHEALARWFEAVQFRAVPKTAYARDRRLLVLHASQWRDADGAPAGTAESASVFTVAGGKVVGYHRNDRPDPLRQEGFRGATELTLPEPTS